MSDPSLPRPPAATSSATGSSSGSVPAPPPAGSVDLDPSGRRAGGRRGLRALRTLFLVVLMTLSGLLLLATVTRSTGVLGFLIGVCLALLPLPLVLAAFRWLDRYEPEPRGLLLFAFFWGATVAALVAAVLNTTTALLLAADQGPEAVTATGAVFVAPWVEEAVKGAAILAVLLFRRREFDGVVDGIVLAGFVGIGFAFTENVLYFGRAFLMGSEQIGAAGGFFAAGVTFVLRGVLAPFAHPLFTTMTGIGLGIAASRRSGAVRWLAPVLGYLAAVVLHAIWNISSLSGLSGFLTGYVVIMIPAFLLTAGVAAWSRRREGATVAGRLPAYVQAGWLAPEDVPMLASLPRRRQARDWVRGRYGEGRSQALRAFQHTATELAFLRDRGERGHAPKDFVERERVLLGELSRARAGVHA